MKITRRQLRQIIKEESEKFDPDTQGSVAVALKSAGLEHLNPSAALNPSEENRLKAFVKENPDLVRKSIMAGTFGTIAALAVGSHALKGKLDFGDYASSHGIDDWTSVRDRRGMELDYVVAEPGAGTRHWGLGDPGNIPVTHGNSMTVQDVIGKKKWARMSDRQREAALHNILGGKSKAQAWAYANPELTIAGAAIASGLLGLGVDYIIQKALGKKKNESLTRKQLRQIIKEELNRTLNEKTYDKYDLAALSRKQDFARNKAGPTLKRTYELLKANPTPKNAELAGQVITNLDINALDLQVAMHTFGKTIDDWEPLGVDIIKHVKSVE